MFNFNLKIFFFLFFLSSCGLANADFQIVENTPGKIQIFLKTPKPEISVVDGVGSRYSHVSVSGWSNTIGEQSLPFYSTILHLESNKIDIKVLSSKTTRIKAFPPLTSQDEAIGPDSLKNLHDLSEMKTENDSFVQKKYLGLFRGNHLWSITFFPFKYEKVSGELVVQSEIMAEIDQNSVEKSLQSTPKIETDFLSGITGLSHQKKNRTTPQQVLSKSAASFDQWKIYVIEEGFYRITGKDLEEAGVELLDIDVENLHLSNNGNDVPVFVKGWEDGQFNEKDFFEFWGEDYKQTFQHKAPDLYKDPYTSTNVYWLSWENKGRWMSLEEGQIPQENQYRYIRPYSFYETVHVERDSYYDRLNSVHIDSTRDHWFYDGGISPGRKMEYTFELFHPDDQSPLPVLPKVMLSGRSMIDSVNHDVSAFLNSSYVGEETWQWQNFLSLEVKNQNQIYGSDLINGENRLTVVNNAKPDEYDMFMLNWFEVTYPRLYRAENDFIKFKIPPNYNSGSFIFKVDGFKSENIEVYKLGYSKITGTVIEEVTDFDDFTSLQISFQDYATSNEIEYIALSPDARKKPYKIELDEPSGLKSSDISADYLLITHDKFIENPILDELEGLRQSQGLRTLRVNVKDIYDEFFNGQESPYAIKKFLKFAYQNWKDPKPQYVLFVGDGCYFNNTATRDTLNYIPVFMRQTKKFGSAASDHWYSLVDGDDEIPDLFVGRLPVRENEDLNVVVRKIIDHETDPAGGSWKNRILFIGGNGAVFRQQAFDVQQHIPPSVESQFLFTTKAPNLDYDPFFGGTADLIDYFEEGCSVINFHGHGGGAIWADNGLLRLEDATRLYNEKKSPLILSMTCFTGSFESPSSSSLADALLFDTEYGSCAMLGAGGVGWVWNDYYLETEILKYLFSRPDATLGEIIAGGKIAYYNKYFGYHSRTQINQYHLLGDPASRLVIPKLDVDVAISDQTLKDGSQVKVDAVLPVDNGTVKLNLLDKEHIVVSSEEQNVSAPQFSTTMTVPEEFSTTSGFVQIYGENSLGMQAFHGAIDFSMTGILFDSSKVTIVDSDSMFFWAKLQSDISLDSLNCICWGDTLQMQKEENDWYKTTVGKRIGLNTNQVYYYFYATITDGGMVKSEAFTFKKSNAGDIQLVYGTLRLGGEDSVNLQVDVYNSGDTAVENVSVEFQEMATDSSFIELGKTTVDISPYQSVTASIPFSEYPAKIYLLVKLNGVNDLYSYNNQLLDSLFVSSFNVSPQKGLTVAGANMDTLSFDDNLKIVAKQNSFSENSSLTIAKVKNVTIYEQPDVRWINSAPVFDFTFGKPTVSLNKPLNVILSLPVEQTAKLDSLGKTIQLFQFNQMLNKWVKLQTSRIGYNFNAQVFRAGEISAFTVDDKQSPNFEFSIDGQPYVEGRMVGQYPNINLLFQDANGVNTKSDKFSIILDGKELEQSELSLPDSVVNANHIAIQLNPKLETGYHAIGFQVADCCGNLTNPVELFVNVSENFDVNMLGNFPNPFVEETVFAYSLTRPCDELTLKVYTASGMLIRSLDVFDFTEDPNPLSADYHELVWDGTDKDGNAVANGVYFYKLVAKSNSETKELVGTIAKIK